MARSAARHAHVLVVEVPGWDGARMASESAVLARGWRLARSPADADVLLVCGRPGRQLAEAVDLVWHQMPGPRVRVDVLDRSDVPEALADAHAGLLDDDRHRRDARERPGASDLLDRGRGHGGTEDESSHDDEHEQHDDHEGHDGHGDMEMSPGGIPLAEGGADRDGLEMDVLEVRLGPVLPHWPAGLVLHCSLHGDVVTAARAEVLRAGEAGGDPAGRRPRVLDQVTSVLALAGWDDAADRARQVRDDEPVRNAEPGVDGGPTDPEALARLRRRVRRSWLLRRSLRGLGVLSEDDARRHGLPGDAVGDTHDRLLRLLDRAEEATPPEERPGFPVGGLAHLVVGLDLAAVRLVLAGLDLGGLPAHPTRQPEAGRG